MRFEYTYIYGAICPDRDIGEALVINSIGKKAMQHHLEAISLRVRHNAHAVLLMDCAPWHKSLKVPSNMTIIYLPSYSPELNPHENIWEYLKNSYLSNRVFDNLEHVMQSCSDAWNALCKETGRIKSIASRNWTTIN
jgi:transposase